MQKTKKPKTIMSDEDATSAFTYLKILQNLLDFGLEY
jgi:hypothetical protein